MSTAGVVGKHGGGEVGPLNSGRFAVTVSLDDHTRIRGIQGEVKNVSRADRVTLTFACFKQSNPGLIAVDFEKNSDRVGVAVSGIIGMPVLWQMALTVDYRNAAVRFQYKVH